MTTPDYLAQLIEKASEKAGGQAALARALDVSPPNVTMWKKGQKPCPIGDQVLMADIAGLKAEEWAGRALVAAYEGTSKGEKLQKALKKLLVATGAAASTSGAIASTIYSETVSHFIRCIERLSFITFGSNLKGNTKPA